MNSSPCLVLTDSVCMSAMETEKCFWHSSSYTFGRRRSRRRTREQMDAALPEGLENLVAVIKRDFGTLALLWSVPSELRTEEPHTTHGHRPNARNPSESAEICSSFLGWRPCGLTLTHARFTRVDESEFAGDVIPCGLGNFGLPVTWHHRSWQARSRCKQAERGGIAVGASSRTMGDERPTSMHRNARNEGSRQKHQELKFPPPPPPPKKKRPPRPQASIPRLWRPECGEAFSLDRSVQGQAVTGGCRCGFRSGSSFAVAGYLLATAHGRHFLCRRILGKVAYPSTCDSPFRFLKELLVLAVQSCGASEFDSAAARRGWEASRRESL